MIERKMYQDNIRIRSFKKEDKQTLAFLANNKNVWDNLRDSNPYPYTEKDAENYINKCLSLKPQTFFAIEYKDELVGSIGLNLQTDVYRKSAEIGYWIGEAYWGKGISPIAVNLITEYAFRNLDLIRIYTGVCDFNTGSQKVLDKCGFNKEGVFKNAIVKNGKVCDEIRYALLR